MNISTGLRGLLKLPEVTGGNLSLPAQEFSQALRQSLEGLNGAMQQVAALASPAEFQALDKQRADLIEKCQQAQTKLGQADAGKATEAQDRVVQAVEGLRKKAAGVLSGAGDGYKQWLAREAAFDDALLRTGELQEAGHPKAKNFLTLGLAIRLKANGKNFGDAIAAYDQWKPKLDVVLKTCDRPSDKQPKEKPPEEKPPTEKPPRKEPDGEKCDDKVAREGLTVLVRDKESGEVIQGAKATVGDQTDTTSDLGLATVELPVGKHRYEVTAKSYEAAKGAVDVVKGDNPELIIELAKCPAREGLTVVVKDKQSGEAIQGAKVSVGDQTDTTSDLGLATVELPVGKHRYEVTAKDYTTAKGSVEVIEGDNPELVVELTKCDVSREGLTVVVKDKESGEVIERAEVTVGDQSDTTSERGLATVELPVGKHDYRVTADKYKEEKGAVEIIKGDNPELIVELTKDEKCKHASLVVAVVDADTREAVEGAKVTVGPKTETTTAAGMVVLTLEPGTHDYEASAADYPNRQTSSVEVQEGDDNELVIELSKEGPCKQASLAVIVVDDDTGVAIEGATVTVADKTETTSASGLVVMTLDPGTHNYEASAADYPEPATGTVEVQEGDDNELTIRLKKEAAKTTVTFHVSEKGSGQAIGGANVNFGGGPGVTEADGRVTFQVNSENYDYVVSKDGYTDATGTAAITEGEHTDQRVELEKEPDFCPPPESKQPTLRKGDESADGWVEYLQNLLNKYLGPGTVETHGKFDQRTYDAVKAFQSAPANQPPQLTPGMLVDGIVGNETWSILRKGPREAVGVNNQPDEQGVEARWATEVSNFVRYDAGADEIQMTAFSVGDAPIDQAMITVKLVRKQTGEDKISQAPLGAPTGPSPTGAGHMHLFRIPRVAAGLPGNTEVDVQAYFAQDLGGDLWQGTVSLAATTTPGTQAAGTGSEAAPPATSPASAASSSGGQAQQGGSSAARQTTEAVTATLSVVVEDARKKPVRGAVVSLKPGDHRPETTNAKGEARFPSVPLGDYEVSVVFADKKQQAAKKTKHNEASFGKAWRIRLG